MRLPYGDDTTAPKSAGLTSVFSKLGMQPDMVDKFKPIVTEYVGKTGGDQAKNLLTSALK